MAARKKPARSMAYLPMPGTRTALLTLKVGKEVRHYKLAELPADFGRGFQLVRLGRPAGDAGPPASDVHLPGGGRPTCECRGSLRHAARHGPCKHAAAVAALLASGRLKPPAAPQQPKPPAGPPPDDDGPDWLADRSV